MQDIIIESSNQSSGASTKVRKVRIRTSRGFIGYLFDLFVKSLLVALLLGIDFLLFVGAGNQAIFDTGVTLTSEVCIVLCGFLIVSFVLLFLVSFSSILQNLLVSLIVFGVVWAMLNQFALYDASSILEPMLTPYIGMEAAYVFHGCSHWMLSVGMAVLTFIILIRSSKVTTLYFVGIFFVILFGILANDFLMKTHKDNFVVRYDNHLDKSVATTARKYVYIFLPNATSYISLGDMKDRSGKVDDAEELKGRLVAFLAKNGFWVYPNAYVTDTEALNNAVEILNNLDDKKANEHILKNVVVDGLWDFSGNHDEYVFLKNAKLIDIYKNSNYGVTAINSRGIDLCMKNNSIFVDKCIDKINMPIDMADFQLDSFGKAKLLFVQWLNSAYFVTDWSVPYSLLDGFVDAAKLPIMGVSYDSLYVVNSFKTLDILLDEIEKDKGNRAYFVFLDLPSDMYVYNEFCKVKPQSKWLNLENYKWVNDKNLFEKRKAYQEQFSCLIGKLEQFMQELHDRKLDENTIIFLQGLNGGSVLGGPAVNDFTETFKYKNSVLFAVKDPARGTFSINNQICESKELLKNYLYLKGDCKEFHGLKVHSSVAKELQKSLLENVLNQNTVNQYLKNYEEWYGKWSVLNKDNSLKNNDESKEVKVNSKEKSNKKVKNDKKKAISVGKKILSEVNAEDVKANVVKQEVVVSDEVKVTDLPAERNVGEAKVIDAPIDEGKEQEVLTIKETSEQEEKNETTELGNENIPLENGTLSENVKAKDMSEVEINEPIDIPAELKENVSQNLDVVN